MVLMRGTYLAWVTLLLALSSAACSAVVSPDTNRLGPIIGTDGGRAMPDGGPPVACTTPGARESVACGNCGTLERFCTGALVWADGPCMGEGVCAPGTMDSVACGNCGTQASRCTAACTWEATGGCMGEGGCAPGTRTRSGDGCPAGSTREVLCSASCAFEPEGMCEMDSCPTPGAIERVGCGNCGTRQRFCTGARVWEYGPCEMEGECAPGTMGTGPCGNCGTRASRCTAMCRWEGTGACMGEGECAPGAMRRSGSGCSGGTTRPETCSAACVFAPSGDCSASRMDVMLLLDVTGSHGMRVDANASTIQSSFVVPVLALGDVAVGVSYYADFAVNPYGSDGDRPFEGGVEPGTVASTIDAELASSPRMSGGDAPESGVEALSVLTGGALPRGGLALPCSGGRVAGGCWRAGARRVIVVYTDAANHNGPIAGGAGLFSPYGDSVVAATWPEVAARLRRDGVELIVLLHPGSSVEAPTQFTQMLVDTGMPVTNRIDAATISTALSMAVARIRTVYGP